MMLPREVQDLGEVSAWLLAQPFCDGQIGSGGISYDGMMAAAAATQGNIKALALVGFYGDVYRDIAVPGGIPCTTPGARTRGRGPWGCGSWGLPIARRASPTSRGEPPLGPSHGG